MVVVWSWPLNGFGGIWSDGRPVFNPAPDLSTMLYICQSRLDGSRQRVTTRAAQVTECVTSNTLSEETVYTCNCRACLDLNTLRSRWNGYSFADGIFAFIFYCEYVSFWFIFHWNMLPMVQLINNSELVQIMAWHRTGDKPLLNQRWPWLRRIYAPPGLDELMSPCLCWQSWLSLNSAGRLLSAPF